MVKNVKAKLIFLIVPIVIAFVVLSYMIILNVAKNIINKQVEARLSVENEVTANFFEQYISDVYKVTSNLSIFTTKTYEYSDVDVYESIVKLNLEKKDSIYGLGVWFEPYVIHENQKYVGVYGYKDDGKVILTDEYLSEEYNYFSQPFYASVKEARQDIVTNFFYDEYLGAYMVAFSSPIFNSQGDFIGCASVDVNLSQLQLIIMRYNDQNGWFYVVNENGNFVAHEDVSLLSSNKNLMDTDNESFLEIVDTILTSDSGDLYYKENGKKYHLYFGTIDELNWKKIFIVPNTVLKEPLNSFNHYYAIAVLILLGSIIIIILNAVNKIINKPINLLVEEFEKIAKNKYITDVPKELTERNDEFGFLGKELGKMKYELKCYGDELASLVRQNVEYAEEMKVQNAQLIENKENLTISYKYSEAVMNAIPDLVFIISKDGNCIDCKGSDEIIGKSSYEYIGKHVKEIIPIEKDAEVILEKINSCITSENSEVFEFGAIVNDIEEHFDVRISKCLEDRVVAIARKITTLYNYMKNVEYLSFNDPLTQLHNRRHHDIELGNLLKNKAFPLSIIVSDLNNLKLINDSFGHEKGDLLLTSYTNALKKVNINNNYISRVGGDEFTILLPNTSKTEAEEIIKKIEEECGKTDINGIPVSASFGIGCVEDESVSYEEALNIAEDNMYNQKLADATERREKTVRLIIDKLDNKFPNNNDQSKRIGKLCQSMAKEIGMSADEQDKIYKAGFFRNIGKIGVEKELFLKEELTVYEKKEINKFIEIGYRILKSSINFADISEYVLYHKEHWDGNGELKKIKGEEIPIQSRIIAISEFYEIAVTEKNLTQEEAIVDLKKYSGTKFDPKLVDIFINKVLVESC